jgi:hypothetical protein
MLLNQCGGSYILLTHLPSYYSQLPEFKGSPYIPVIGTIASGMSYIAAPGMIHVAKRYSRYRKLMIWIGCTDAEPFHGDRADNSQGQYVY